ncbi:alpha/beta hydrolase [Crossiella sp. CA-258035]|uniref:serine aminopeptidase domain-containing protein n=1 Tax=Crossiella sp. CA-258035 TaxID=2981138 RepID=UPI0024BCED51|nr:alpha/beta hydrolase [Crossiella sp. CA-258035]WHT16235.1 alpha/beta hydrolase [Crossiella sp. CA-258035]
MTVDLAHERDVQRVTFLGPARDRVFTVLHLPRGSRPRGGVVLCPPLLTDALAIARTELALARELAARGIVTARFHYRGTGHSDGADGELDLATMIADTERVAAAVSVHTGSAPFALAGSRLGCYPAAAVAARTGAAVLGLAPFAEPDHYFKQAFRTRFMRELVLKDRDRRSSKELFAALAEGETVDVLGYPVTARCHASLRERRLGQELAGVRALLVTVGGAAGQNAPVHELAADGVEIEDLSAPVDWWLVGEQSEPSPALVARCADWLSERCADA